MNPKRIQKWLGIGILALMATFVLTTGLAVTASADGGDPPACKDLACNDPSDCGSKCFCNNPTNTYGVCVVDEEELD